MWHGPNYFRQMVKFSCDMVHTSSDGSGSKNGASNIPWLLKHINRMVTITWLYLGIICIYSWTLYAPTMMVYFNRTIQHVIRAKLARSGLMSIKQVLNFHARSFYLQISPSCGQPDGRV